MEIKGVWLPIITPFLNGSVDIKSYQKLINYYIEKGISGLVPLGTTGESPTVSEDEFFRIVEAAVETVDKRIPIIVGVGGNYTDKVVKMLKKINHYQIQGILSVCPYYNRPDQNGIYQHFLKLSEATELPIIIYNIPYRTGRNIENDTIRKLAELKNIVGLKDSCGIVKQTLDLLINPPTDFSILTGEDIFFYLTLVYGGSGGILASAHLSTESYINIYKLVQDNDHGSALQEWKRIAPVIPLLFEEPNPAPIKYCLRSLGLIDSSETRLPLTSISKSLEQKLGKNLK